MSKEDAETAMEMTPSPVGLRSSAPSDSPRYHTCYPSGTPCIEPDFPADLSHPARNVVLAHDAEQESLPRRAVTTRVSRHTELGIMGPGPWGEAGDLEEDQRLDGDGASDTMMGRE